MSNHVVFVQTDEKLESAISFSQYVFNGIRLITLIGELHNTSFKCGDNVKSISICNYCKQAVSKNTKTRVLLEYSNGGKKCKPDDPYQMNSYSIRSICKKIEKIGRKNQLIPLDKRPIFLSRKVQDDLYGKGWKKYKLHEDFKKAFIDPFFNNKEYFDSIPPFLQTYYNKMVLFFKKIEKKISKKEDLDSIHRELHDAWKLVADYFIIKEMLNDRNDVNEYILIIGEAHRINIDDVFDSLSKKTHIKIQKLGSTRHGKKNSCVELYETYQF